MKKRQFSSGKRGIGEIKIQISSTEVYLSEYNVKTSGGTVIYHGAFSSIKHLIKWCKAIGVTKFQIGKQLFKLLYKYKMYLL